MPQNLASRRKNWQTRRSQPKESSGSVLTKHEEVPGSTVSGVTREPSSRCVGVGSEICGSTGKMDNTQTVISNRRQSILYTASTSVDDAIGQPGVDCLHVKERSESSFITPFAQILSIMKRAHAALLLYKQTMDMSGTGGDGTKTIENKSAEKWQLSRQDAAMELRDLFGEFDWCLKVLESLECRRSVSSLTMRKFCRILSRELSTSFSLSDNLGGLTINEVPGDTEEDEETANNTGDTKTANSGDATQEHVHESRPYLSQSANRGHMNTQSTTSSQICDYIYRTFVEDDDIAELDLTTNAIGNDSRRSDGKLCAAQSSPNEFPCAGTGNLSITVSIENGVNPQSDRREYLVKLWKEAGFTFDTQKVLKYIYTFQESYAPDLFELHMMSGHHTLSTFGMNALMRRNLLSRLFIPAKTMHKCLTQIEALYNQKAPFHNSVHATDVLLSMDYLLRLNNIESSFTDLEMFATLFACAIHDIDHPAVTNQYLINTGNELALLYNDNSVLENHHLHVAFNLLRKQPDCDVTSAFTAQQRSLFRKMVINLVLSTDMSKHMTLVADLKTTLESQRAAGFTEFHLDSYSARMQILQCLVHASDLSNPTKPLSIYRQWVDRIAEEMFQQGDREREAGLEISPMCDRQTACVNANQVGFIDYVVYPLWETVSELVHPEASFILDTIQTNRDWFAGAQVTDSPS